MCIFGKKPSISSDAHVSIDGKATPCFRSFKYLNVVLVFMVCHMSHLQYKEKHSMQVFIVYCKLALQPLQLSNSLIVSAVSSILMLF